MGRREKASLLKTGGSDQSVVSGNIQRKSLCLQLTQPSHTCTSGISDFEVLYYNDETTGSNFGELL